MASSLLSLLRRAFRRWREYIFKNPFKNLEKRLTLWYVGLVLLILADEYIKEGYILNPRDFLIPLTHENLILVLTLVFLVLRHRVRKRGGS